MDTYILVCKPIKNANFCCITRCVCKDPGLTSMQTPMLVTYHPSLYHFRSFILLRHCFSHLPPPRRPGKLNLTACRRENNWVAHITRGACCLSRPTRAPVSPDCQESTLWSPYNLRNPLVWPANVAEHMSYSSSGSARRDQLGLLEYLECSSDEKATILHTVHIMTNV